MRGKSGQAARRSLAALTAAAVLLGSWTAALRPEGISLPRMLMRVQLGGWGAAATAESGAGQGRFSPLTNFLVHDSALLTAVRDVLPGGEEAEDAAGENSETKEGTVLRDGDESAEDIAAESDNGVAAKTIRPASEKGYLVWKDVYITNTSVHDPDLEALMRERPAARLTDELPQVLIIHTHGTEAYTMPAGQEYNSDGSTRTTDTNYNVVRVGDEIAAVFEEHGISVLHDRTLYDAESYNDAYSLAEEAIDAYLQKYPSIHFVLDIHRDAIEDSAGNTYKVISQVNGKNAAQLSIVVGTDGSGAPHENWEENLKLAVLLQQNLLEHYPTLMRPMYLRNSRYNEHATTGSLLIEVGAAGNSLDEALYAARLFAGQMVEVLETLR